MEHEALDASIDRLARSVTDAHRSSRDGQSESWREVWELIREIGRSFSGTRYPTLADKQVAWERFQDIVSDVKQQQTAYFKERERQQSTWKDRSSRSDAAKREIISLAKAAWPHEDGFMEFLGMITGAAILADVTVAAIGLAVNVMTFGLLGPDQVDDEKSRLLSYSANMREAWQAYGRFKDILLPHDRDMARKTLVGVQGELDKEWDKYKLAQQERRNAREGQWSRNRDAKQQLVAEAQGLVGRHKDPDARQRAKEIFQEWRGIRSAGRDADESLWSEFRAALDAFYERSRDDYRTHVLEQIEKVEGLISKTEANIEANKVRLDGARNEEFAERVQGWISEEEERLEKYQDWLSEWQAKLRGLDND